MPNQETAKFDPNSSSVQSKISQAIRDYSREVDSSNPDAHISYVYALCEKTEAGELIPFYIGEGQDGRVWAHEKEAEDSPKAEKELREKLAKDSMPSTEIDNAVLELRRKINKINEIKSSKTSSLEKVIVKWGMTKDEAFMCESALINLLDMGLLKFDTNNESLTNKANGHKSLAEKMSGKDTKARTIEEFYRDLCPEKVEFEKVLLTDINAVFICINKSFMESVDIVKDKNQMVRGSVCGCWKMDTNKTPRYVFAIRGSTVEGVYRIKEDETGRPLVFSILDNDQKEYYPYYPGCESEFTPVPARKGDYEVADIIRKAVGRKTDITYADLPQDAKDYVKKEFKMTKDSDAENAFKNWCKRVFFALEDADEPEVTEYIGKQIVYSEGFVNYLKAKQKMEIDEYKKERKKREDNGIAVKAKEATFKEKSDSIFPPSGAIRYLDITDDLKLYIAEHKDEDIYGQLYAKYKLDDKKIETIRANDIRNMKDRIEKKLNV